MRRVEVVEIVEEDIGRLPEHAAIDCTFVVENCCDVLEHDGAFTLVEHPIATSWVKDYDATGLPPAAWPERFDVSKWGLLAAYLEGDRVGGAVVAVDSAGVDMLEGRGDLACLWDLRVEPRARRHGVAKALLSAAERWARERDYATLKVETQDVNVAACRLYSSLGCELRAVNRHAYAELPNEAQLLWYKPLGGASSRLSP